MNEIFVGNKVNIIFNSLFFIISYEQFFTFYKKLKLKVFFLNAPFRSNHLFIIYCIQSFIS